MLRQHRRPGEKTFVDFCDGIALTDPVRGERVPTQLFVAAIRSRSTVVRPSRQSRWNDRVVPFFDEHEVPLLRILTDRGTEHCGNPERHEYPPYVALEDIDHTKTKNPQMNEICERFPKTDLGRGNDSEKERSVGGP